MPPHRDHRYHERAVAGGDWPVNAEEPVDEHARDLAKDGGPDLDELVECFGRQHKQLAVAQRVYVRRARLSCDYRDLAEQVAGPDLGLSLIHI